MLYDHWVGYQILNTIRLHFCIETGGMQSHCLCDLVKTPVMG